MLPSLPIRVHRILLVRPPWFVAKVLFPLVSTFLSKKLKNRRAACLKRGPGICCGSAGSYPRTPDVLSLGCLEAVTSLARSRLRSRRRAGGALTFSPSTGICLIPEVDGGVDKLFEYLPPAAVPAEVGGTAAFDMAAWAASTLEHL